MTYWVNIVTAVESLNHCFLILICFCLVNVLLSTKLVHLLVRCLYLFNIELFDYLIFVRPKIDKFINVHVYHLQNVSFLNCFSLSRIFTTLKLFYLRNESTVPFFSYYSHHLHHFYVSFGCLVFPTHISWQSRHGLPYIIRIFYLFW